MLNSRAEVASMTPEPFVSCSKGPPVLEVKAHLMRVLIAEDDPALASFVRKGLEAEHYAVDVTTDGEQARAMAGELDYDLLMLDLNLPRVDGVTILRHLRTRKPSLPILVLTSRNRVEDRVHRTGRQPGLT